MILSHDRIYFGRWSDEDDLIESFADPKAGGEAAMVKALRGVEILLADYRHQSFSSYDADAFVLFRKGRKLFEINAGHGSYYGLEGQWDPEEVDIGAMRYRRAKGDWREPNPYQNEYPDAPLFYCRLDYIIDQWAKRKKPPA